MNTCAVARLVLNIVVFELVWLVCVELAARHAPGWAVATVAMAVALHLTLSDYRAADAALTAAAIVLGFMWETIAIRAGWIEYASPSPIAGIAPAWILALWALFATTLRGPLRWMHGRPIVAALLGAVGGPLSYSAAAHLGACSFPQALASMIALGMGWAVMTPALVALARRWDFTTGASG